MKVAKWILRYVMGTFDYGLVYSFYENYKLVGYSGSLVVTFSS